MSLKNSMSFLIEDMKKQDAAVAADIMHYATLRDAKNKHDKAALQRNEERELLKSMFSVIGGKLAAEADSIHVKALKEKTISEQQSAAEIAKKIGERQAYYEAIEERRLVAFWKTGDEAGILAAIYYSFDRLESASTFFDTCYRQISDSPKEAQTPAVMRYLLEKTLIKSDMGNENDKEQEQLDEKLQLAFSQARKDSEEKIWNHIAAALRIRETQRISRSCERLTEEFSSWQKRFEEAESSYRRVTNTMQDGLNALNTNKCDKDIKKHIQTAKNWYAESSKNLNELLGKCKERTAIVLYEIDYLQRCKAGLVFEEATGIEHQTALGLMQSIAQKEEQFAEFKGLQQLEDALSKAQEEYKVHLTKINNIKSKKIREAQAEEHKKAAKKAERKEMISNIIYDLGVIIYMLGAILMFILGGAAFGWQDDWVVDGILGFLPAPATAETVFVEDTASPYLISMGKLDYVSAGYENDLKMIWAPFANKEDFGVSFSYLEGEKIYIPKNANHLSVSSCDNIVTLDIPQNIKELNVKDCQSLEQINTEEGAVIVKEIDNCPVYKE